MLIQTSSVVFLASLSIAQENDIDSLTGKTILNSENVRCSVGFLDTTTTPYPSNLDSYNVNIDESENCYVQFPNTTDTGEYNLLSLTDEEAGRFCVGELGTGGDLFLTHEGPCGVCSTLNDLEVYLTQTNLADPVRECALSTTQKECIITTTGFTDDCASIWAFNTVATREKCLGPCILYSLAENIQEELLLPTDINHCDPEVCGTSINGGPTCSSEQFENGEFRLNPCLQCDECFSGPMFQKVSGRTRRNSGIISAIPRPPATIASIVHNYTAGSSSHICRAEVPGSVTQVDVCTPTVSGDSPLWGRGVLHALLGSIVVPILLNRGGFFGF